MRIRVGGGRVEGSPNDWLKVFDQLCPRLSRAPPRGVPVRRVENHFPSKPLLVQEMELRPHTL